MNAPPDVLALHASGVDGRAWTPLATAVSGTARVHCPDLLGYGRNPPIPRGAAFDADDDLTLAERRLLSLDGPAHLVGHSYGGWLALRLALRHPERTRSVFVHEPVVWGVLRAAGSPEEIAAFDGFDADGRMFDDAIGGTDPWLERFIDFWSGPGTWAAFSERRRDGQRAVGWKVYQEVRAVFFDARGPDHWAPLQPPVHITVGEQAPPLERRALELLLPHLRQAELTEVPGGHMAPLTHPGPFLAQVSRALKLG